MTDHETHPAGTADLVKRLSAYEGRMFETTACYNGLREKAADHIEQLEAELTRANAATAAAYEVAARTAQNVGIPVGAGDGYGTYIPGTSADAARAIRALATPDQTAALDKLIAEAEARIIDSVSSYIKLTYGDRWSFLDNPIDRQRILAASKKGGTA